MMEALMIFIIILLTGIAGYLLKFLTLSGAFSAVLVGIAVNAGFGIKGLFLLGVFFATSSLWSNYKRSFKTTMEEKLAKGATRDYRQVIANGGAAALFSLIYYFQPERLWAIGFVVCLASANSDTWASEIGSLSRKNPVYIRTFKRIEKGTSGAVSSLGTVAALAGSLLITFISVWLFHFQLSITFIIFLFGYIGNVIDTVMGAFYQQAFICNQCGLETEKRTHCGQPTTRIKGISFVDNDIVNFLSGLAAAILAICLGYLIS
jgi:uncharacterized protein (TIGR00297 family)